MLWKDGDNKHLGTRQIKGAGLGFESWRKSSNCPSVAYTCQQHPGQLMATELGFKGGLPRKRMGGPMLEQKARELLCHQKPEKTMSSALETRTYQLRE